MIYFLNPTTQAVYAYDDSDHAWIEDARYNGWQQLAHGAAPEAAIADILSAKRAEIAAAARTALAPVLLTYPEWERDTWPTQEKEARAWLADPAAATPLLDTIAQSRGLELGDLVARVISKAAEYKTVAGAVVARHRTLVEAAEAAAALPDDAAARAALYEIMW